MKHLLLSPLLIVLLTSCQSKRDICAQYSGGNISIEEAAKKLGVINAYGGWVRSYCEFYKK